MDKQDVQNIVRTEIAAALRGVARDGDNQLRRNWIHSSWLESAADKLDPPKPKPKFKPGDLVCQVDNPTNLCMVAPNGSFVWTNTGTPYAFACRRNWRIAVLADVMGYVNAFPSSARDTIIRLVRLIGRHDD